MMISTVSELIAALKLVKQKHGLVWKLHQHTYIRARCGLVTGTPGFIYCCPISALGEKPRAAVLATTIGDVEIELKKAVIAASDRHQVHDEKLRAKLLVDLELWRSNRDDHLDPYK